jgi:hypothetical protein
VPVYTRKTFEPTDQGTLLLQRVCSAARAEACAAAERLVAIWELFTVRMRDTEETVDWVVVAMDAVCAEIASALSISHGLAASHVRYARALREQLPLVGRASSPVTSMKRRSAPWCFGLA